MNIKNRPVTSPELQVPTAKLMRIEEVPNDPFVGFCLWLNNGVRINLPPVALKTVKDLLIGDDLEFVPREDIFEGEPRKFDDQTRITIKRSKNSSIEFVVGNECILTKKVGKSAITNA